VAYVIIKYIRDKDSKNATGGTMQAGDTYSFWADADHKREREFKAGDRVIIFMCPDGYSSQNQKTIVKWTGTTKRTFFMHKWINQQLGITYDSGYGTNDKDTYKYCQIATFFTADCQNTVLCIEDIANGSDHDFNDIIFSIADNPTGDAVTRFTAPKYTVGKDNGKMFIAETENLYP